MIRRTRSVRSGFTDPAHGLISNVCNRKKGGSIVTLQLEELEPREASSSAGLALWQQVYPILQGAQAYAIPQAELVGGQYIAGQVARLPGMPPVQQAQMLVAIQLESVMFPAMGLAYGQMLDTLNSSVMGTLGS